MDHLMIVITRITSQKSVYQEIMIMQYNVISIEVSFVYHALFLSTLSAGKDCYPGEIRLSDSEYYENNEGFTYISGYPVLCVDDELLPLCNSTMPQLLELTSICQATVNLTCKSCNSITMESMYYHTHRWFPWYSRLPNITVLFWWF